MHNGFHRSPKTFCIMFQSIITVNGRGLLSMRGQLLGLSSPDHFSFFFFFSLICVSSIIRFKLVNCINQHCTHPLKYTKRSNTWKFYSHFLSIFHSKQGIRFFSCFCVVVFFLHIFVYFNLDFECIFRPMIWKKRSKKKNPVLYFELEPMD